MKSKLFLIYFLNLFACMIQLIFPNSDYYSNFLNPSEKKCNNEFIFKSEFCYMDVDYTPEFLNYEQESENSINKVDTESINENLLTYNNIEGNKLRQKITESENFEIINSYNKNPKENLETIDYYYYEKGLSNEDMTEEQCLNSFNYPDNKSSNKKCCFIEVNYEANDKLVWKNCLIISETNLKDNKYLESLIPKFDEPTIAQIKCNDFYFIKRIPASRVSHCENKVNPSSKEQCNNIKLLQSKCCYTITEYKSKIIKKCEEYDKDFINLEYDYKKYLKLDLIVKKLLEEENITDYNSVIKDLNSEIPKSKKIYCNSLTKYIDYSDVKITKKDLIIAQKDGFCSNIFKDISVDKCLNGLLFSEFVSKGGQCCYLEIRSLEKGKILKQCVPLTKYSRENNYLIEIYIEQYKPSEEYTALIVCDGFKAKYNSLTGKWIVSSGKNG